jgi:hypothetical protein
MKDGKADDICKQVGIAGFAAKESATEMPRRLILRFHRARGHFDLNDVVPKNHEHRR